MKVLHITNHFWPSTGGVEKFILDLCRESMKTGITCEVLCLNRPHHSKEILPPFGEIEGIKITRIPFVNLTYYKPALLPLEKLKEADVLHVHGVGALLDFVVATKILHKKPIVVSTHGGIFHTKALSLVKKAYFFGFERWVLKGVNQVVACSRNDEALFASISNRLIRIDNGVELKRFDASLGEKKKNVFLYVGRISKNKCIDQLIETFGALNEKEKSFELRLVGEDWEGIRSELEKKAQSQGIADKIVFVGHVSESELVREYQNASFFVSASRYEGFGISAIEGMAAGCIPIVNPIDSFKNFISEGKNGFFVEYPNPIQAAQKIEEIASKKLDPLRVNAQKTAQEYGWDRKINDWIKVYQRIGGATQWV